MSGSMRMNLNLKFEQLAVRIETQLGSKVETSIANKMGNISATLSSLKNTMSNLEKKIEPNEKSGIRVPPEEKLEIRLQKVNASLESVLSRKEEEDKKTMDELGRLREDVTKWENELERDPGDRIALRYRDISVKIYTKRKEAHEKMMKEEAEIIEELKKEKLHMEISLQQLRAKDLGAVMNMEKSRKEREVKCNNLVVEVPLDQVKWHLSK
jgi:hypothetical protein